MLQNFSYNEKISTRTNPAIEQFVFFFKLDYDAIIWGLSQKVMMLYFKMSCEEARLMGDFG